MEFVVRPYRASDREHVYRIAADTAFFGEPVEAFLEDRRLFCDFFCRYYTDFEADHAWVACQDETVGGYLLGCVDTTAQRKIWARFILPTLLMRLLGGYYKIGRRTWHYLQASIGAALVGSYPHPNRRLFPAHLHVNVRAEWRGQGIGCKLIEVYLDQLRELKVPGLHLNTTNLNISACRLYEKLGFRLLESRSTRMWKNLIEEPVENRCYGLRILQSAQ